MQSSTIKITFNIFTSQDSWEDALEEEKEEKIVEAAPKPKKSTKQRIEEKEVRNQIQLDVVKVENLIKISLL